VESGGEPSPAWLSETAPSTPDPQSRPRIRWRDLTATAATEPIPPEGSRETEIAAAGTSDPNTARVARGSPREPETFCRFDPKLRRIEDFRLPDLKGRPVRFQDFDSDLILLDFWGTWCHPCIRSVPHLVDLQKRMGGKQLQVIGIACEREETPAAQRVAGVARTSTKLGINYPVLVSSLDGTCPLQNALHVQAFPTLILLDRQGRILWQDQGATHLTMARLDRMLSLASKPADGRARY
jgi:thiol-disulfide isomerase/thioredoxin